jgi:radical SAM superfamily enzyme YgiQ (UPF0313 family)
MKVLLVYPKNPVTFWSFEFALGFIGKKSAYPPLGLLTVAALLPPQWPQRLVDLNVTNLADKDIEWADMVFIGGMAVQRASAVAIIDRCKAAGVKVVGGGPLFTVEPEAFRKVDHLVLDEAELSLPPFLQDLQRGCARRIYRAAGFCDIRKTPKPAWHLIRMKHYACMSIQFSRGCPYNCEFCNVTVLFGHRMRMKSSQQVIEELDGIYAAGWRASIFFVDDNFIGNKKYLKEHLLPALIEWRRDKKGCGFFTEASINLADDTELMDMMVQAGFDSVFIGIESPDDNCLAECRKTHNRDRDLVGDIKKLHRKGLQVMGGFIVGFDSDSPSIFQRQIDFIQNSSIVTAMVGMLQAPPGTRLFERLSKENRVSRFFSGDNVDGETNIIPRMGLERLVDGYRNIMEEIYAPRLYYRRIRALMKELKVPAARPTLNFQHFLAFFRSCVRLGIIGRERFYYWHLLCWTLVRKPRMLHSAITLAIYGHHYRKVCRMYIL